MHLGFKSFRSVTASASWRRPRRRSLGQANIGGGGGGPGGAGGAGGPPGDRAHAYQTGPGGAGVTASALLVAAQPTPLSGNAHMDVSSSPVDRAAKFVKEGVFSVYSELVRCPPMYKPLAVAMVAWETLQLLSYVISLTPAFQWASTPIMSGLALVLQVASFGYYVPDPTGLRTGLFGASLGLVLLTLVTVGWLTFAMHPSQNEAVLKAPGLMKSLYLLLIFVTQGAYMPILSQLVSVFRCHPATVGAFLGRPTCWDTGHVILLIVIVISLPFYIGLAGFTVTTMFERNPVAKDPLARSHGRIHIAHLMVKTLLVLIFLADQALSVWILIVVVAASCFACLYLYVGYLPYYWLFMNQVATGGYLAAVWSIAPLILGVVQANPSSNVAGWTLWFGAPVAACGGYVLASLQWHHWVDSPSYEVTNVYQVELKIRRTLAHENPESVYEFVDSMFGEALKYFSSATMIHLFIAQYLHVYRRNRHLERGHLMALESRSVPLDEQFIVWHRRRVIAEEDQHDDHMNVLTRLKIEKHKREAQQLALQARQMQLTFWTEMCQDSPSIVVLSSLADELWRTMHKCETHFRYLLSLNTSSGSALRMFAQYLMEVANHSSRAQDLLQQADDLDAAQARENNRDVDIVFKATSALLDASQENIAVLAVSHNPATLGIITDCNQAALQAFGYAKRELLGKSIDILIPAPMAAAHQAWMVAYLATGHMCMMGTNRSVYGLHRNGYIFGVAQTTRDTDDGFRTCDMGLNSSDNVVFITPTDMKVTAVCQRTLTAFRLSARRVRDFQVNAHDIFPRFGELWSTYQGDVAAYEEAALRQADGRAARAELLVPHEIVYNTCAQFPDTTGEDLPEISCRIQHVKMSGCAFLVIKWRQGVAAADKDDDDMPLFGSQMQIADGPGEQLQEFGSALLNVPGPSEHRAVATVAQPVKPAPRMQSLPEYRTYATGDSENNTTTGAGDGGDNGGGGGRQHVSGAESVGSNNSSTAGLRRVIEDAMRHSGAARRQLGRTILTLLGCVAAIVIANYVIQNIVFTQFLTTMEVLKQAAQRQKVLEDSLMCAQDLWLHGTGIAPLATAERAALRSRFLDDLTEFETLHRSLYLRVTSATPLLLQQYSVPSLSIQSIDAHGLRTSALANLLAAGLDYVARGRLAADLPPEGFVDASPSVYFVLMNGPAALAAAANQSVMLQDMYGHQNFELMDSVQTLVMIIVSIVTATFSIALIIPVLNKMDHTRTEAFKTFLQVPLPVLRAIRRRCEQWVLAAQRLDTDDDEDHDDLDMLNDNGVDAAGELSDVLAGLANNRTFSRQPRKFQGYAFHRCGLIFLVWIPLLLCVGGFVGLIAWVQSASHSLSTTGTQYLTARQLEILPYQLEYQLRMSSATSNSTLAHVALATVVSRAAMTGSVEHDLLFKYSDTGVQTAGDAHAAFSSLMLHDGCTWENRATCQDFYDGLFNSGLHAALSEFLHLTAQRARSVSTAWQSTRNATVGRQELMGPDAVAMRVMTHSYLIQGLSRAHELLLNDMNSFVASTDVSVLMTTIVYVLGLFVLYVMFYRPMLGRLDRELHRARGMLLLFPDEVVRGVPAVWAMLKSISTTQ